VFLTYPNDTSKIPRNILRSPRNPNPLIARNNNRRSNVLIRKLELALIESQQLSLDRTQRSQNTRPTDKTPHINLHSGTTL
jgi:hypothetical protein